MPIFTKSIVLDYMTESEIDKSLSDIESNLINFFEHCIKWNYQRYRQSTSWIKTIINSSRSIYFDMYNKKTNKFNKNILNKIDNNFIYNCYTVGLKNAIRVTKINIVDNNLIFEDFDSIYKIIDESLIRLWLKYEDYNSGCKISRTYNDEIDILIDNKK